MLQGAHSSVAVLLLCLVQLACDADCSPNGFTSPPAPVLTRNDVETFRRDGVLVVPILSPEEVAAARRGLHATLARHGIDHRRWNASATQLRPLQLTGGKGGIVDIYVDEWAMRLRTHPRLFAAISQLWDATWADGGTEGFRAPTTSNYMFNSSAGGFVYLDRAVWRLPLPGAGAPRSAQPALLPHFDQCPLDLYGARGLTSPPTRWRPIQSSISLRCYSKRISSFLYMACRNMS